MKKLPLILGLVALLTMGTLTVAMAKSNDLFKKNNETYREAWQSVKDNDFGKDMFKAMEKGDTEAMKELMSAPDAAEKMTDVMNEPAVQQYHNEMHNDPEFQQYHDEMHQDPEMQNLHNEMHSGSGSMMGGSMGGMMGF
ncbi:MAG: hypothetical protein CVU89_12375 [Firmicutes bacterium HGW-Firmicutes-14]|nr:MAG: hypothetical protein CVU89_12375 [Firmicutes bacterium HGW-Firmicutes-14]